MKFDVAFLFGGQIKGDRLRLYMIYSAGNFIECTVDTPYLQIGEHKYGKPILNHAGQIRHRYLRRTEDQPALDELHDPVQSGRRPADRLAWWSAATRWDAELAYRIEPGEPYFHDLSERWSAALRAAHMGIPRPPYVTPR